ncbi:MAG: hypothetical protein ACO1RT_12740 [Planctomycetaceae bacterium]
MRTSARCRQLIEELASKPITATTVLALRRQIGEDAARELLEIAKLQPKAIKKFGDGVWMATARSVEQASHHLVAAYKASLMGDRIVVDLCGGIGGDAMGFARRGAVITVDLDPQMTRMAAENLRSIQAAQAIAVCADATTYISAAELASRGAGLHIDPDRRPGERRLSAPEEYQPSLAAMSTMLDAASASLVKLAPAAVLNETVSDRYHRQWISLAGTVREQMILGGECLDAAGLRPGTRSAVRLMKDGSQAIFKTDCRNLDQYCNSVPSPLNYIVDIDPGVRAAGLSAAFAESHNLFCLGDPSGFFTSDSLPAASPLMQRFECLWSGPADKKLIRKQIASRGLRVQVAKVRGTDHDPARFLKSLNLPQAGAGQDAVVLLGRNGNAVYAVLAIRVSSGTHGTGE